MFQKIQNLIEKLKEKGQGVVEYALLLGFVAIIVAYFTTSNGLTQQTKDAMSHMNAQASAINSQYSDLNPAQQAGSGT